MNKTISINVGGIVFNIEEDAYQKLYHYLNSIKNQFSSQEERDEIMRDIEARIAEIFQSQLAPGKEVILDKDVEEMIGIMGRPEDYVTEGESSHAKTERENAQSGGSSAKRLFRDPENETIGGVCSGISQYLQVDVVIVRIIFILLTILGGSGILIYLVLWIAVPEAKTTSDKMQMRGLDINVESIKEHFQKFKGDLSDKAKSGKFRRTFNETVDKSIQVGSRALNAFGKILGTALIIGGTLFLITWIMLLFGNTDFLPISHHESIGAILDSIYPSDFQSSIVYLCVFVVTLIPILGMLVSGVRLLFSIKTSFKTINIVSSILWSVALGVLIITGINLGLNMKSQATLEYPIAVNDSTEIIYVDVAPDKIFSNHLTYENDYGHDELIHLDTQHIYFAYPRLYLSQKSDSGDFEVILHKRSLGSTYNNAIEKAEKIQYQTFFENNMLTLNPYYMVDVSDKLRGQEVWVEIMIPLGKEVRLGENIDRIRVDVQHLKEDDDYCEIESYSNTSWSNSGGIQKTN